MSLSTDDVDAAYEHVTGLKSVQFDRETFGEQLRACYRTLVEVARDGETISYEELTSRLGLDSREPLRTLLDGIAYIEHRNDRPPLPVIVVQASKRKPGVGFFDTVDRLGLRKGYRAKTDRELLGMMATNVYAQWQSAEADCGA